MKNVHNDVLQKRHECDHPCHEHESCPATTRQEIVKVQCQCDRLVKNVTCNVKSNQSTEGNDDIDLSQPLVQALSVRTIDLPPVQKLQLECDDECCYRMQENKNLAQAASINLDKSRQSSIVYTDVLLNLQGEI